LPEHLSDKQLAAFRLRRLTPADLLAVDDHLAACEECRLKLPEAVVGRAFGALRAQLETGPPTHLTYEQMERYVDGGSDGVEREIAEAHLDACAGCADETADLAEFRAKGTPSVTPRPSYFTAPVRRWLLLPAAAVLVWGSTFLFQKRPVSEPTEQRTTAEHASPSPAAISLSLEDGGRRVTLDEQGHLKGLPALSAEQEASVRASLQTGQLETPPFLAGLVGEPGTLLGTTTEKDALRLVDPLGTAVETDQPTLRWRPLEGATSYTAAIFDARLNPVATSPAMTSTEWTVPKRLPRGQDYSWQVTALQDGREITAPAPPAPEARFRVLEESLAEEMRTARQAYAGSHLALGLLYARTGLVLEAERELGALAAANPQSSLARDLLKQLKAVRR
jgi:hypothetical protein